MKIVADTNIPFAVEAFGHLGSVVRVAGRDMPRDVVRNADVLIVRSVTKVNAELLDGTPVKFVGTCTIGFDHVDREYLQGRGIGFASAPGSNANSVAEYVVAALLVLARRDRYRLAGKTIGVVGVGNVGKRVVEKAEVLGMRVLQNDPPLRRETGDPRYLPIETLLEEADILTFHVPLTRTGADATFHMIDDRMIGRLKPGTILINTSRGAVADSQALLRAAEAGKVGGLILDVFEGEPAIDPRLVERCDIATPHIAGYSFDGKVNGIAMVYRAACDFFEKPAKWNPADVILDPPYPRRYAKEGGEDEDVLHDLIVRLYDIEADDARLRRILDMPAEERGPYFDRLRKEYPFRREFPSTLVEAAEAPPALQAKIAGLGFRVRT